MSLEDYKEALKFGQRAYRHAIANGDYPYIPALDDMISFTDIERESNLGLVEIPINLIVGTKSEGRTSSFASNFMPLLGIDSEFCAKWVSLSKSLQEEGLRDPIKVYEYLNHFYVLEGNKRVSVMKYFGSVSIPALVTRVVPKKTNTKENHIYYEFMDFYQLSEINYLIFSEIGDYKKLQEAVGKKANEMWTQDDRREFHSFFTRFEQAYREKAGKNPKMSVSDAVLVYLNLYPYETSKNHMPVDFKVNLEKSWEEFLVNAEDEALKLSMKPTTENTINVITRMFDVKPEYKIAFVHDKSVQTSSWTYAHELGRLYLQEKFDDRINVTVYESVNPSNLTSATNVIEEAINDGNEIIFTTTPKLLKASLKAAIEHPEVKILNCSLNTTHSYLRTYYGRMYEAKFIVGMIAGAMAESDEIGYIADYPIYGMTANINAFALGAKMVNPRAKIHLEWSTLTNQNIRENFTNRGVCYISDRDMIIPEKASREFGLYYDDGHSDKLFNIATPIWHWGKFYELILRSIINGSWKNEKPDKAKALNYWWGMSAGVIEVILSQKLPVGVRRLVELVKDNICSDNFHPFAGKIYDQDGQLRHSEDDPMKPEEIIRMDWLVDNVDGYIPSMNQLNEEAKQIVEIQGVKKEDV